MIALTGVAASCSSTSSSTPSMPETLDPSRTLVALSDTERGMLCDWYAQRVGGYSHTILCEATGTPLEIDDRATCIRDYDLQAMQHPGCPTTVGTYQSCVEFFLANWCSTTPPTLPADCATFQSQCFPINTSGAPSLDGGGE
jgi:hypothetical protein